MLDIADEAPFRITLCVRERPPFVLDSYSRDVHESVVTCFGGLAATPPDVVRFNPLGRVAGLRYEQIRLHLRLPSLSNLRTQDKNDSRAAGSRSSQFIRAEYTDLQIGRKGLAFRLQRYWTRKKADSMRGYSTSQALLFPDVESVSLRQATASTFVDNMKLPVHRWFRFSAGFSAQWVQQVIAEEQRSRPVTVLDPFAGAGTTLLAAERMGVESTGVEAHPFVRRIAQTKLLYRTDHQAFLKQAKAVRQCAARMQGGAEDYPKLIHKCFDSEALIGLDRLRRAWEKLNDDSAASQLTWLTLVSILRLVSHAGTAPWQYVLPRKKKKAPLEAMAAFELMTRTMAHDMKEAGAITGPHAHLVESDARTCSGVPSGFADLVVTSPPYANNYDYADATRLEMCFMREINGWGDLQGTIRQRLIRSCSQHVPESAVSLDRVLAAPELKQIHGEISEVCHQLAKVRLQKGGKKTYHLMVACYFLDIAQVWQALRRVCKQSARACFVIGDSAPYGIYVPVMEWTGALAKAAGFDSFSFEKTRDRNVKWKNRKHRVPLCEGRLWVQG